MLRSLRVAGAIAAILTVAACGKPAADGAAAPAVTDTAYPGQSAAQVLDRARAAVSDTDAVQLDGTATTEGTNISGMPAAPVSFTVNVVNGRGSIGEVTMGAGKMKIVVIGDRTYSQMDQEMLNQLGPLGTSLGSALGGKWLLASTSDMAGVSSMAGSYQPVSLLSAFSTAGSTLEQSIPASSTLTRVPGKVINGMQTTGVHFAGGSPASTTGTGEISGTVYIAVSGTPYPVSLERPDATLQLSHWNQRVPLKKPASADVVTVDQLGLGHQELTSSLTDQLSGYTG